MIQITVLNSKLFFLKVDLTVIIFLTKEKVMLQIGGIRMCPFYNNDEKSQQQKPLFSIKAKEMMEGKEIETASKIMELVMNPPLTEKREIVFLCIGSDRYVGDALGPLVGTMLREKQVPYHVYGTLKEPVHAFNLKDVLKNINKKLKNPFIISIDASIGEKSQVGFIIFKQGPLSPGKALNKVLPDVGDYHIKGVVNYIDPLPPSQFVNDTRLFTVVNFAKTIVEIITLTGTKTSS